MQAICHVESHNPICSCSQGFRGDPFTRCITEPVLPPTPPPPRDPCNPSPCGSNALCRVGGNRAVCSCIKDYQVHFCYPLTMVIFPILRLQYWTFLYYFPFSYRSSNFAIAKVVALKLFSEE